MIDHHTINNRLGDLFGATDSWQPNVLSTAAATGQSSETQQITVDDHREVWVTLINQTLIEWGRNLSEFVADGLAPIGKPALQLACRFSVGSKKDGDKPPSRILPTVDGGVVFVWDFPAEKGEIELQFNVDGSAELTGFKQGKVISFRAFGVKQPS